MPSSDLIEFHANALALAVLIQAQAKSKDKAEDKGDTERVSYPKTHKESLNKPLTKITRQGIWNMVDERMEGGHLFGAILKRANYIDTRAALGIAR
jgi:hypothetical protein